MYIKTIIIGLISWLVGLFVDVNVNIWDAEPGVLCLRVVLPVIAVGAMIIKAIKDKKDT